MRGCREEHKTAKLVKAVIKRVETITRTYDPELQRIIHEHILNSPATLYQDIVDTYVVVV